MRYKNGHKFVSEKDFGIIKNLLDLGAKPKLIQKATGKAPITIFHIGKVTTLAEYRALVKVYNAKGKQEKTEKAVIESKETNKPETPIYDVMVEIREELRKLNAYIVAKGGKGKFRLF
jgi:hypothetical protein